ncbi:MAG: protein kinase [Gammaproteobacteria bacterium]|nr:protein kinase [Gammaproteobacteria bacterium]
MPAIDKVKRLLKQYKFTGTIGAGSMGTVYLAENIALSRNVAVKVTETQDKYARERFLSESKIQAKLAHPNILSLLDAGQVDDLLYITTPLVEGRSLQDVLNQRSYLGINDALDLALAVSQALDYAHANGVIHRDIKPANVLIPKEGEQYQFDKALVSDFSVVGILEEDTQSTQIGQVFGTPKYMSPEQLKGDKQTSKTDIYGIGLLLYEMIYGKALYQADNSISLMHQILEAEVSLPASPIIPNELKKLIISCLSKNSEERPGNISNQLKYIMDSNDPVSDATVIRPSSKTFSTPMFEDAAPIEESSQKNRSFTLLIGVVGILLVLFGFTFWFSNEMPESTSSVMGIFIGVALIVIGLLLARMISVWFKEKQGDVQDQASQVLFGLRSKEDLSNTLAIEIDEIISRCRSADEKILGSSMAIMLDEYRNASSFEDRKSALVTAIDFLEKLTTRLSPWYIKYEKLIVILVSMTGLITGLLKIIDTVTKA